MGYQTLDAVRPRLGGKPPTPVVEITLCRPWLLEPKSSGSGYRFITTSMRKQIRKLRSEGATLHKIAAEVGVTHNTVYLHTKDIRPPPGGWSKGGHVSKLDRVAAYRLRRDGLTYKAIGEKLGCSESGAFKLIKGRRNSGRGSNPQVTVRVSAMAKISGLSCADLRTTAGGRWNKGDARLSKARAILFWALSTCDGMKFATIGRQLGGFHGSTVGDGAHRTSRAIVMLGMKTPQYPAHLMRPLWEADWAIVPCAR